MKFPQELITWKILPAIRAKLAIELKEQGLTQREVAEILGLTPPAVSQYMSGKRAADYSFGPEYDKYFKKVLKYIEKKPEKAKMVVLQLCDKIERTDEFKTMMLEL